MLSPGFDIEDAGGDSLTAKLGEQALRMEEWLREVYEGEFQALTVAIVVEGVVIDESNDNAINPIHFACSDHRRWVQEKLLQEATDLASELNVGRHNEVKKALGIDEDDA